MTIKKYSKKELKETEDKTDYQRAKNMSDEEIEKNAQEDPDALPPTDEQMKKFKKVKNNV